MEQVDAVKTGAIPDGMEIAAIIPLQLSSEDPDAGTCRTQAESAEPAVCFACLARAEGIVGPADLSV